MVEDTDALLRFGVLAVLTDAQRPRLQQNQMALPPANRLCPPPALVRTAWTIPWKAFGAQDTDPPIMRRFGPNPNFESFWLLGQP